MFKKSSAKERPSHWANSTGTAFKNPWPSANPPTWSEAFELSFPFSLYPNLHTHSHARPIEVVEPDWGEASLKAQGIDQGARDCVIGTWLGHAGVLVEFTPLTCSTVEKEKSVYLLFDPIFSERAGPTAYTGPSRVRKSPCRISELPGCDAVFISHNHYDHLDLATVRAVIENFPGTMWFVPLGNGKWLANTGVDGELIQEMDWWESKEGSFAHGRFQSLPEGVNTGTSFKISCTPAQHNSGRSGLDGGSTLWSGWAIERFTTATTTTNDSIQQTRKGAIYHAGDTGYRRTTKSPITCPAFQEIGNRFHGFDLSFIPIWRGGSLGFISYMGLRLSHHDIPSALHCSPTDALEIHRDVKSRNTIGVHFGTFIGSENESFDALIEFCEASERVGIGRLDGDGVGENGRAGTLDLGGSFAVVVGGEEDGMCN
ncbi:N-acyl-phosphatidylethanolamine-hydrolyzing phospholipase D [Venturia nashicola]|uniref:N-acyl-phosphatidylethanolamine-hydrolyzing phospholipase D n=1 Tax=Venturia nashicola TaxID=86259 RepID=A0A4Z1PLX9_9PEZI|nr:N-acyl-phosphatidylethanolamine-hydrolyzing phospholipase D [Venturia nashicola]